MPIYLGIVSLREDRPDLKLSKGSRGTIVEIYSSEDVEVEFVNDKGETVALETLKMQDLEEVNPKS